MYAQCPLQGPCCGGIGWLFTIWGRIHYKQLFITINRSLRSLTSVCCSINIDVWLAGCVELISVRLQIINTYFYTVKLYSKVIFRLIWGHKNNMWLSSHRSRQVYMRLVFRIISVSSPLEILRLIDFSVSSKPNNRVTLYRSFSEFSRT